MQNKLFIFIVLIITLVSCEKTIDLDLPQSEPQIVVDGFIELGQPPIVFLTKSVNYFDPVSTNYFEQGIIRDAEVKVVVRQDTFPLQRICTSDLPDSLQPFIGLLTGLPYDTVLNICVYTDFTFNPALIGIEKESYELIINALGTEAKAVTTIPQTVTLDSLWFRINGDRDSLGFIYAHINEPATPGNAYRWWAQRTNSYTYGPQEGELKDANYISPFNSVFNDDLVNGRSFDFGYNRGIIGGSTKLDDRNIERGFFKKGDTVDVKFATIDNGVYEYFRSFYLSLSNSGSPFANPGNVITNINGGLGVWAGYGVTKYTLVIPKDTL